MSIGKKIAGGFGLSLVFLIVVGSLSFWGNSKLIEINRQLTRSYEILLDLEETFSNLKDAQRGLRGFVLTGIEDPWLEPYNTARQLLPKKMERLTDATGGKYQEKLGEIQKLIDAMF